MSRTNVERMRIRLPFAQNVTREREREQEHEREREWSLSASVFLPLTDTQNESADLDLRILPQLVTPFYHTCQCPCARFSYNLSASAEQGKPCTFVYR